MNGTDISAEELASIARACTPEEILANPDMKRVFKYKKELLLLMERFPDKNDFNNFLSEFDALLGVFNANVTVWE